MSKIILDKLQDKRAYVHVFAGLLLDPNKLSQVREFPLSEDDFVEKFHKIIFSAIHNLFHEGIEKITPMEIDGYLSNFKTLHTVFEANEGLEYLFKLEELGEPENFDYHYTRVKKFTLLRQYYSSGIDISEIYSVDPLLNTEEEILNNKRFNEMTIDQMIKFVESKLIDIKDKFIFDNEGYEGHISENLDAILESKMQAPSYGASFPSGFYNTATRGARKRKLYCVSGSSGSGKTRKGLADTLSFSVPFIYDIDKKKWVKTGATGSSLFITTELEEEEIKIPCLCYIAGVEENKIYDNELFEEERERLRIAKKILEKTPFWIVELFDFDVDDIEHVIQKYINKHGVEYVFFDYIHSTLKMFDSMAKQGAKNLQEHQLLRIMTIHLKNMCNKYDVHIGTSTQLNDNWKSEGNLDQSALEGSKSIVNKLDLGAIQLPLTIKDEQLYEEIKAEANFNFGESPTHTINIYKNRGNRWKGIRIWVHFNLGTLRTKDLFVTDYKGRVLTMHPKKIKYMLADLDVELDDIAVLKELSNFNETEVEQVEIVEPTTEMDTDLQRELSDTYKEIFEDELPESFNEKINSFGLTKTETVTKKEKLAKELLEW